MKTYQLANDVTIPALGFGTWQIADGEAAYGAVLEALRVGYRHIDTAQIYGNEASVGKAIADSGIPRSEIFVTTKVWNNQAGYEDTIQSVQESLERLGVDYLDLLLIHWPNPAALRQEPGWQVRNSRVWQALEHLYEEGKVRAIGVSNFMQHHLEELLKTARILPMVNQLMLAPGCHQKDLVAYCRDKGILLEAYSPFGTGTLFQNQEAKTLADSYDCSVSQLALAWSLQKGFLPLPRSVQAAHIKTNFDLLEQKLDAETIAFLDQLEGVNHQLDPDQATF